MIVTILDIQEVFIKLINHEMSRDEADRFAFKIYNDNNMLDKYQFCPIEYKDIILNSLSYLWGIDMYADNKKTYLYSDEEIQTNFEQKFKIEITDELIENIRKCFVDGIILNNNWIMCPNLNCNETFEVKPKHCIVDCPKCKTRMYNPYYEKPNDHP